MESTVKCAAVATLLFATNILHAQFQLSTADLATIESCTQLSGDEMPPIGTFYSAADPNLPPAPGNFFELSGWSLGNGYYLLDDLNGNGSSGEFHAMDDSGPAFPGGWSGGGGSGPIFYSSYSPPTNGLYLQITNVANGFVYANLNGATDTVYEIFSTTNLALAAMAVSNWDIETEVFPGGSTNSIPFSVPIDGRNPLFLWARDWTGITSNGNQTPDWWLYYWFGVDGLGLSDGDLAPNDDTIHYDYTHNLDPNPVQFSIVASQYINSNLVPMQLSISAGNPSSIALVDSASFIPEGETWYPYTSSNIIANLAPVEGQHDIWIGLKGWQTNATVAWEEAVLNLNTNAPVIVVTNPVTDTVCQPLIQVQGLISEQLSSLTFDVSNALQVLTNQTGYTSESFYDTNVFQFTANVFQLYDLRLTNGLNAITIHATDVWGNVTTTNLNVILDYSGDTNPPKLSIEWPQNGTLIGGGNFTLQAQVDDITATVIASINGQTNSGVVQRNGQVRGLTLPLSGGTNVVTVTATDAAGNSVATNLMLVQSTVTLTINPIPSDQANQSLVNVTGTVSDPSASVTVNGARAEVDSNGNWNAAVPVSATGMATIDAMAGDSSNNPVGSQDFEQPQPPVLEVQSMYDNSFMWNDSYEATFGSCWVPEYGPNNNEYWVNGVGGTEYYENQTDDGHCGDPIDTSTSSTPLSTNSFSNHSIYYYYNDFESGALSDGNLWAEGRNANFCLVRDTGGEGQPGTLQTIAVLGSVTYSDSLEDGEHLGPPETLSYPGQKFLNCGLINANGTTNGLARVTIPAGASLPNLMPSAPYKIYYPQLQLTNFTLQIIDNNNNRNILSGQTNTVIVGQQMNLACQLNLTNAAFMNSMLKNIQWTVPGYAISNYVVAPDTSSAYVATNFPTSNTNVVFYWVDGATSRVVQCSAMIDGMAISNQAVFDVLSPLPQFSAQAIGTIAADTNYHYDHYDINTGDIDDDGAQGGSWLHLGIASSWTNVGVAFIFSNAPTILSTGTPYGRYFLVQTVDYGDIKKNIFDGTNSIGLERIQYGLDTSYPYQSQRDFWHSGGYSYRTNDSWFDAPASSLDQSTWLSRTNSFTTYLMFQASQGGYDNSIPVPMWSAEWNWAGVARTNSALGYSLLSSSPPSPIASQTLAFPLWDVNATNLQYGTNSLPFNEN